MKNLISTSDLSDIQIESILSKAKACKFNSLINNSNKNQRKIIISLFFENSTRTRTSFDIAVQKIGAKIIHLDVLRSSINKGETIEDTILNISSMNPDLLIIRHESNGFPKKISSIINTPIINAGDGSNLHPTQALIDLYTIIDEYGIDNLNGKVVSIIGDISNSRVANSNIELLKRFGMKVILVCPKEFIGKIKYSNLEIIEDIEKAIDKSNILIRLRTQTERSNDYNEKFLEKYAKDYCITEKLIKDKNLIILHPGPVHRNIDISDNVLKDKRCKVLNQVENGIYIRMAILDLILNG